MKLFVYIHDPTSWGITLETWAFRADDTRGEEGQAVSHGLYHHCWNIVDIEDQTESVS